MDPNATRNPWKAPLVAAILAGLALIVLVSVWMPPPRPALPVYSVPQATGVANPPSMTVPGTTPTGAYSEEGLLATAWAIASTLPTASPDPHLPDNKAVGFQRNDLWNRAIRTAIALYPPPLGYHPPDIFTPIVDLTPEPTEPIRAAGAGVIYDDGWSTLFGKQMHIVNKWWETVGTRMTIVCAGGTFPPEDTLQGKVLVAIEDTTTHAVVSGPDFYLTPSRHGLVRVIDAVRERLTLRAVDGTLFYFDVPSRQWVAPPPGPSPTP